MSEISGIAKHLEELRKRILRIVIVILIVTISLLSIHIEPIDIMGVSLYYPTISPLNNTAAQITNHMRDNLVPDTVELIQTAPGQAFFAQVYIAALVGIIVSMPIIVRELIGFLRPALKDKEINTSKTISIPAVALFITGCLFAYFFIIPYILEYLYKFGDASGLVTFLNIMDFVSFVLQFLLAFGISFQLPLIMYAASASGITDVKFWRKNIRYAIIAIVFFGAIITPDGSGITMWFIALPMMALYVVGMLLIERKHKKD